MGILINPKGRSLLHPEPWPRGIRAFRYTSRDAPRGLKNNIYKISHFVAIFHRPLGPEPSEVEGGFTPLAHLNKPLACLNPLDKLGILSAVTPWGISQNSPNPNAEYRKSFNFRYS